MDPNRPEVAERIIQTEGGKYHLGHQREGGPLETPEACNLDQAEALVVFDFLPHGYQVRDLCLRCFPEARNDSLSHE